LLRRPIRSEIAEAVRPGADRMRNARAQPLPLPHLVR
jgi:hypothetical protein